MKPITVEIAMEYVKLYSQYNRTKRITKFEVYDDGLSVTFVNKDNSYRTVEVRDGDEFTTLFKMNSKHY